MTMDPVSFLQLFCNQNNYQLDFTSISEQKTPGAMFVFRCDMENLNSIGTAASKKRAKQVSARMMISQMIENDLFGFYDMTRVNLVLEADRVKEAKEEANRLQQGEGGDVENNPVSKLSELCVKKRWALPVYQDQGQIGPPHERVFQVNCILQNLKQTTMGEGSNKKAARRAAAQKMMDYLREENHDLVDEVLDRLPGSSDKYSEGSTFIDCIKRSKNKHYQFGKLTISHKVNEINEKLAKNPDIWNYIKKIGNGNVNNFCLREWEKMTSEELETIVINLAKIGDFQVQKNRSQDEYFLFNISFEKDDFIFYSWYAKASDKDSASKKAYVVTLKAFIDEMILHRD